MHLFHVISAKVVLSPRILCSNRFIILYCESVENQQLVTCENGCEYFKGVKKRDRITIPFYAIVVTTHRVISIFPEGNTIGIKPFDKQMF